eukprot:scaffold2808_cov255-Pinguiococcus_pyrenoidosus.AAC.19
MRRFERFSAAAGLDGRQALAWKPATGVASTPARRRSPRIMVRLCGGEAKRSAGCRGRNPGARSGTRDSLEKNCEANAASGVAPRLDAGLRRGFFLGVLQDPSQLGSESFDLAFGVEVMQGHAQEIWKAAELRIEPRAGCRCHSDVNVRCSQ